MFTATAELPATKSVAPRVVHATRNFDRTNPADVTITVTELRKRGRTISSRYGATEIPAPRGLNGRAFMVCKETHAGDGDTVKGRAGIARTSSVYECCIAARGVSTCTCPAGSAKLACVHVLALAKLIADGGLEHPMDGPSR